MSAKNLNPYLSSIRDRIIRIHSNYVNESEKLEVGTIIPSLVPLDEEYFLPCDGRILSIFDEKYKSLYEAIGDRYANETDEKVEKGYFKIPRIEGRLIRSVDPTGTLDDANRPLGDNKPWGVSENAKTDFDLLNQDNFVKNDQSFISTEHTDDQDTVPIHIIGQDVGSNFKTKNLRFVANGGGEPRVSEKVSFSKMSVYAYIYYKPFTI